jgi:ubiquinone/menaquinone biosynthesis C-methylase UbiE
MSVPKVSPKVTRGYGLLERFLAKKRAQQANKLIPHLYRSGKILDIGSGTYPFFLLTTSFAEKYGIDKTFFDSTHERRDDHALALIQHDIESGNPLPYRDEYFDVITMLAVFEHITPQRLTDIFQDVYRILKKGGLLVITTPAPWTSSILKGMALLRLVSALEIMEHKRLYTSDSIIDTLRHGGFALGSICIGHFELYMNTWVTAQK